MNAYSKRKGVTLIEFLLAALIGVTVIMVIGSILFFSLQTLPHSEREYDVQQALRMSADVATKKIESATTLFLLPDQKLSDADLKPHWNYLGLSADGTEIVNYIYDKDSGAHSKQILARGNLAFIYDFVASKRADSNIIDFAISATNQATSAVKTLTVSARPINANYIDAPTLGTQLSYAFAYRDRQIADEKTVAAVSILVDASASMNDDLAGNLTVDDSAKRIVAVENALLGHADKQNVVKGIINEFSAENAVEMALIPFNLTANIPLPNKFSTAADDSLIHRYQFYDVASKAEREDLFNAVRKLSGVVGNGSNVGDALRRAYYSHLRFANEVQSSSEYGAGHSTENYIIVVLDGAATYASSVGGTSSDRFKDDAGDQPYLSINADPAKWFSAGIIGYGDKTSTPAEQYVRLFGDKIKTLNSGIYIVAYTENATELTQIRDIANVLGVTNDHFYPVTTSYDIDAIMTDIKQAIVKDLWTVRGPK